MSELGDCILAEGMEGVIYYLTLIGQKIGTLLSFRKGYRFQTIRSKKLDRQIRRSAVNFHCSRFESLRVCPETIHSNC
jgi:hypothetical protein